MTDLYSLGCQDSFAGIRPQLSDDKYMLGYNETQVASGKLSMQPPSDSGKGKRLDPDLLAGALASLRGVSAVRRTR